VRADRLDRRSLSALAVAHGCVDVCQGAVPALLPFLVLDRGYSYAAAGSLVLVLGLRATPLLALVPLAGAVIAVPTLRRLGERGLEASSRPATGGVGRETRWAFARLAALIGVQTGLAFGLLAFVPLYLITAAGAGKATGNAAAAVLLVAGAVGTLLGGHFADRAGHRPVLVLPQLVLLPAVLALPNRNLVVAFLLLVVIGVAMDANFSTALVLGQEYLPRHVGLASGVILGVSVGLGGLISAGLGVLADRTSLETALYAVAILPALAFGLGLTLPEPDR
jgi:FSR family fosmidomycin resistance protein-like MFS transporter